MAEQHKETIVVEIDPSRAVASAKKIKAEFDKVRSAVSKKLDIKSFTSDFDKIRNSIISVTQELKNAQKFKLDLNKKIIGLRPKGAVLSGLRSIISLLKQITSVKIVNLNSKIKVESFGKTVTSLRRINDQLEKLKVNAEKLKLKEVFKNFQVDPRIINTLKSFRAHLTSIGKSVKPTLNLNKMIQVINNAIKRVALLLKNLNKLQNRSVNVRGLSAAINSIRIANARIEKITSKNVVIKIKADFSKLGTAADKVQKDLDKIRAKAASITPVPNIFSAIKTGAKNAVSAVSSVGSAISSFKAKIPGIATLIKRVFQVSVISFGLFTASIFKAGTELNKFLSTMLVIKGDTAGARQELEYLRDTANRLGVSFGAVAAPFARFAASAKGVFTTLETRKMFEAFSKVSVALHLTESDVKGVFFALQQMVSKGTISAEELRRQLAERIPGAVKIAADSMKLSMTSFLSQLRTGSIRAQDFMVAFSEEMEKRFGAAAEFASKTAFAAWNRLGDTILKVKQDIAQGGAFEALGEVFDAISNKIKSVFKETDVLDNLIQDVSADFIKIIEGVEASDIAATINLWASAMAGLASFARATVLQMATLQAYLSGDFDKGAALLRSEVEFQTARKLDDKISLLETTAEKLREAHDKVGDFGGRPIATTEIHNLSLEYAKLSQDAIKLGATQDQITQIQLNNWQKQEKAIKNISFATADLTAEIIAEQAAVEQGIETDFKRTPLFILQEKLKAVADTLKESRDKFSALSIKFEVKGLNNDEKERIAILSSSIRELLPAKLKLESQVTEEQRKQLKIQTDISDKAESALKKRESALENLRGTNKIPSRPAVDLQTFNTQGLKEYSNELSELIDNTRDQIAANVELGVQNGRSLKDIISLTKENKGLNKSLDSLEGQYKKVTSEIKKQAKELAKAKDRYADVKAEIKDFGSLKFGLPLPSKEALAILAKYPDGLADTAEGYDELSEAQKENLGAMREWGQTLGGTFSELLADGDSFTKNLGDMFDNMLDRMLSSIYDFSINQLVTGLFSGNIGQSLLGAAGTALSIGASYLLADDAPERPEASRTTREGDDRALGFQQIVTADIQARDVFYAEQLSVFKQMSQDLRIQSQAVSGNILSLKDNLVRWTDSLTEGFGSSIQGFIPTELSAAFDLTSFVFEGGGISNLVGDYISDLLVNSLSGSVGSTAVTQGLQSATENYLGNITSETGRVLADGLDQGLTGLGSAVADRLAVEFQSGINGGISNGLSGFDQALADAINPQFESATGQGLAGGTQALDNISAAGGALTALYSIFQLVNDWDDLSTANKIFSTLSTSVSVIGAGVSIAVQAGVTALQGVLAAIPIVGWIIAGAINVYQGIKQLIDGQTLSGANTLIGGPVHGLATQLVGENNAATDFAMGPELAPLFLFNRLFLKDREPNSYLVSQQSRERDNFDSFGDSDPFFSHTGNKDARVGIDSQLGETIFSTHEISQTQEQVREMFGGILLTIRDVDNSVADAINNADEAMGSAGETMRFYNKWLESNRFEQKQNLDELNVASSISDRYATLIDVFADSETSVGLAFNAWVDFFADKFGDENILGIVSNVADTFDKLIQVPTELLQFMDDSIKSISLGGTPEDALTEITDIVTTFTNLKVGLNSLGETAISDTEIIQFLSHLNSIGSAVVESGQSLLQYATVLDKSNINIKQGIQDLFGYIEEQQFDDAGVSNFISSVGSFSSLASTFNLSSTLDSLSDISVIVGEIATANLDAAEYDTLKDQAVEYGGLTVTEARAEIESLGLATGDAILKVVNDVTFFQSTLRIFGTDLSSLGIQMGGALVSFSADLIEAMGGIEEASKTFDELSKLYLSESEQIGVAIEGLLFSSEQLQQVVNRPDLNFSNFWDEFNIEIRKGSLTANDLTNWTNLGISLGQINGLREKEIEILRDEANKLEESTKARANFIQFIDDSMRLLNLAGTATNADADNLVDAFSGQDNVENKWNNFFNNFYSDLERAGVASNQSALRAESAIQSLNLPGLTKDTFKEVFTGLLQQKKLTAEQTIAWLDVAESIGIANAAADELVSTLSGQLSEVISASDDRYQREIDFLKQINGYIDSLDVNPTLSPLTNKERFEETRAQFNTQLALANAGDQDARGTITQFADRYLSEARGQFASGTDFTDIFNNVKTALSGLGDGIEQQTDGQLVTSALVSQTLDLIDESRASASQIIEAIKGSFSQAQIESSKIFDAVFRRQLDNNGFQDVNQTNFEQYFDIFAALPSLSVAQQDMANGIRDLYNEISPDNNVLTTVFSDDLIRQFVDVATPRELYDAAISNNISIERVSRAMGVSVEIIAAWVAQNGSNSLRSDGTQGFSNPTVSPPALVNNSVPTVDDFGPSFSGRDDPRTAALISTAPVGINDSQIRDFLATNPTGHEIHAAALQYGVSSSRLAANWEGVSQEDILTWAANNGLPAFADGGDYLGGLALVGEKGPELINFNSPAQVYTAGETDSILNNTGGTDDSALLSKIQQLIDETIKSRDSAREDTGATIEASAESGEALAQAITQSQEKLSGDTQYQNNTVALD